MRLKILVSLLMVGALSGCGNKGNGSADTGPSAPVPGPALPGQVHPSKFSGRAGNFAGNWRGECRLTSGQVASESCSAQIKITQKHGMLDMSVELRATTQGHTERNRSRAIFSINGNKLQGDSGRFGAIGEGAFTVVTPPNANGATVRTTLERLENNRLLLVMVGQRGPVQVLVEGQLRGMGRPLPRSRSGSR